MNFGLNMSLYKTGVRIVIQCHNHIIIYPMNKIQLPYKNRIMIKTIKINIHSKVYVNYRGIIKLKQDNKSCPFIEKLL